MRPDGHARAQDARFRHADAAHFRWTTIEPGFASAEDELLAHRLGRLPFPCLEVGCGEGTNLARLAAHGRPVGADRHLEKVRFAARAVPRAAVVVADATALPFRERTFAGVLVRDLLHHLPDPVRAMREAVSALRAGGKLLVLEPNGRNPLVALQARVMASEAGLRGFTPEIVLAMLEGLPLAEVRIEMAQALPLRRLLLHYRFGWPGLGRRPRAVAALASLERVAARHIPRVRWSYAVVTATRLERPAAGETA